MVYLCLKPTYITSEQSNLENRAVSFCFMRKTLLKNFLLFNLFVFVGAVNSLFAQTPQETPKKVNFRYSQNPKTKAKVENQQTPAGIVENNSTTTENTETEFESRSVASKTLEIVRRANAATVSPTEIYKVGIGDILFISLQNAPPKESNFYTVLNDGTIDYPLAGEMVSVSGLTVEEIEDLLKEKIKLYENPQVSVKVREHASHSITVLGLVEKAGEKFLQREAIPLYVVRAEAIVESRATIALIKRGNAETEQINLKDSKSDDVLIFPGDIIEFKTDETQEAKANQPKFYYIGGAINSAGQKEFYPGITLTQAILASGGLKKSSVKRVVLRRKNTEGLLSPLEFDLSAIKAGKQPDPVLQAGDTIEVEN